MSEPERPPDQLPAGPDDPTRVGFPVPSGPAGPDMPIARDPWAPAPSQPGPPPPVDPWAPSGQPAAQPPVPGPYPRDAGGGFQPVQTPPADPGQPWLIALVAVLLVAVLGVLAYMLLTGGQADPTPNASPTSGPTAAGQLTPEPPASPAQTASISPTALPSPSTAASPPGSAGATAPASPAASLPSDIAAQIDGVVSQVPAIRELEQRTAVPYEVITREQFEDVLRDLLAEETDPEQLAAEERMLKRLGLLPPEFDLAAAIEELYSGQVAAFYRTDTKTFYIIQRDAPFGALDRVFVAHEYTHALQDQHFDLEEVLASDPMEADAALAQLAVTEGDASLVMSRWAEQNLSFEELIEVVTQALSPTNQEVLQDMPTILRRQAEFPYADGPMFANAIQTRGGWSAVNEAIVDQPLSTEQILHPDAYFADELPVPVEMPDLSGALGDGWTSVHQQTMGELNMQAWVAGGEEPPLSIPGLPVPLPHTEVAAGWGGDRLHMYEHPDGGWAIAWLIAWDSEEDAIEFRERAGELAPTLPGTPTIFTSVGDNTTEFVAASDVSIVNALSAALGER